MAGSKKNWIRATKGKCDVQNQLDLGSIDFLQHQHPSSIIGSSQLGLVTRDISKPGILSRVSLVLSSSTTELPAWIYWKTCKPCFTMFGIKSTALRERALFRFPIIFSLRLLVLVAGKEPFTSTIGCKLFMFKNLLVFDLCSFFQFSLIQVLYYLFKHRQTLLTCLPIDSGRHLCGGRRRD